MSAESSHSVATPEAAVSDPEGMVGRQSKNARLTTEERFVLSEATLSHPLAVVLNGWAPPSAEWGGKARHVARLGAAATALARLGLIDVYEEHTGVDEPTLLSRDEAVDAVGTAGNWWREDADAGGDVDSTFYSVAITDQGRAELASAGGGILLPWLRMRSAYE